VTEYALRLRAVDHWLVAAGAQSIEHPGGTLLAHLRRTRERLAAWGGDERGQLGALIHAAYGTDGFSTPLLSLSRRGELRRLVGEEAEDDVYLYCCCSRAETYRDLARGILRVVDRFSSTSREVSADQARRFVQLTTANELDVFEWSPSLRTAHAPWLVQWAQNCSAWLPQAALTEVTALGQHLSSS
jgi:hypothetical protein